MNKVTIIDESICDLIHKELEIYTTDGTFKLKLSDVTRELPIIQVTYHHSTFDNSGDPLMEDVEYTYKLLDNFIGICHPIDKDVQKLKGDRVLNYISFSEKKCIISNYSLYLYLNKFNEKD